MKRSLVILLTAVSISAMTVGTAFPAFAEATEAEAEETTDGAENAADSELEDGVYGVEFDTDSSMFHVNEACNGRATLTVKDGKMTVHITLVSKNIENVFLGTAEDAQKDGAELIQPTIDKVTYSDGMTEEVYRLVRCIFELRTMTEQGLMPELFRCVNCGEEIAGKENLFFSQEAHGILDGDCLKKASPGEARTARRISQAALYTMQYIVSSPMTKLYSFTVTEEVLWELERHIQPYVAGNTDKKFKSLQILEVMM